MGKRLASLDVRTRTALVICLCFLLSSSGYLSWLYRVMDLVRPERVEFLTLACGYLMQTAGIGLFMLVTHGARVSNSRRVMGLAIVVNLLALAPATLTSSLPLTLGAGCVANVLYGVMQGYYLMLLCVQVEHQYRGTVFGCAYGASTLLTWLLSLPAGGALTRGIPCLICCLALSAAVITLLDMPPARTPQAVDATPACVSKVVPVACVTIVLASVVRTAGFSFPADDLAAGFPLEFSRLLYGAGVAAAGVASDRDRRFGLGVCALSLVMPFLMLALSGAEAPTALLWALGYLLTSIYVLFSVLLAVDLASDANRPWLAGSGMLLRHMGDALGTSLCLALSRAPVVLIVLTAALFVMAAVAFVLLYQRFFVTPAPTPEPVVSPEQLEHRRFERFAAACELSPRERDVLRLVLNEKSNSEIAGELVLSERTVKFHMTNLLRKTGCKTRMEILSSYAEQP